jgi:myo-inositol 2-dehydrogenase/D-chiro-inositol 1-dehydrogenase
MEKLRIGFVGCGVIASAHALSLEGLAKAGLVAAEISKVYDVDDHRTERFARHFGAVAASGLAEVIDGSDAVYVCTSTAGHLEAVRAAAQAGRPIFCEKPLARDLPETLSLVEAATVPTQVGLVLRTAPVFRRLGEIARSEEFGRPMAVLWRDDQFFPIQGHYASKWRSDVTIAGSGALLEHSIHDVDIMSACFGQVAWVSATVAGFSGFEGIEDSVSALMRLDSGLSVSLVSVWHQVLTRPSTRRVEVLFERAFVSLDDDFTGPLTIQTSEGSETAECPPPDWVMAVPLPAGGIGLAVRPYLEENRSFVDAITKGEAPAPGLTEALAAHRVVDACYRSAATGGAPMSLADHQIGRGSSQGPVK